MKNLAEIVDSPLPIFNDIILRIGKELSVIYNYDIYGTNNCIFDNKNVLLFNFIKFSLTDKNELKVQFKKSLTINDFDLVSKTINNWKEIKPVIFRYFLMLETIQNNLDYSVNIEYINSILSDIKKPNLHEKIYLIPHKNKIFTDLDNKDDKTLKNIFGKFSYVINFMKTTKDYLKYNIIRVTKSDLNENNSIESIRPLEKDYIYEGTVTIKNVGQFLKNLMFYGTIEN